MSGAKECYGMLSMRIGLQAINQTRGEQKSLSGPTAKSVADFSSCFLNLVWPCLCHPVSCCISSLNVFVFSFLTSHMMVPNSLMAPRLFPPPSIFCSSLEIQRDGGNERERHPGGLRSASINDTVFSCLRIWQVQTGCDPWASPHLSVKAALSICKHINKCIHFLCAFRFFMNKCIYSWSWRVCERACLYVCEWEIAKGGMWTERRGWQAC